MLCVFETQFEKLFKSKDILSTANSCKIRNLLICALNSVQNSIILSSSRKSEQICSDIKFQNKIILTFCKALHQHLRKKTISVELIGFDKSSALPNRHLFHTNPEVYKLNRFAPSLDQRKNLFCHDTLWHNAAAVRVAQCNYIATIN